MRPTPPRRMVLYASPPSELISGFLVPFVRGGADADAPWFTFPKQKFSHGRLTKF